MTFAGMEQDKIVHTFACAFSDFTKAAMLGLFIFFMIRKLQLIRPHN